MKTITIQKQNSLKTELIIYYPYLYSEWTIEYKRFFGKKRKDKRFLITNLVKGETNFLDHPLEVEDMLKTPEFVLPHKWGDEEALREGKEFLRRYYIHVIRSWSVPDIQEIQSYVVLLPYEIFKRASKNQIKLYLYENLSQSIDLVDRYKEIKDFLKTRGVCS
jgi:hypothetical protein